MCFLVLAIIVGTEEDVENDEVEDREHEQYEYHGT